MCSRFGKHERSNTGTRRPRWHDEQQAQKRGVGTHAPTPNLDPELVRVCTPSTSRPAPTALILLTALSISNIRPLFSPLLCRPILGEKWRISSQTLTFHTPLNGSLNTSTRARWTSTEGLRRGFHKRNTSDSTQVNQSRSLLATSPV